MKYIKKFSTSLLYQNNKLSNPHYNTPFLGYAEDIDYVYFDNQADNETDDKRFALIGDWVLAKADGSKLFVGDKVYLEKYVNSEEWTPIAKVVVPYNVFGDKTVRCVSLKYMDVHNPEIGRDSWLYIYFGDDTHYIPGFLLNGDSIRYSIIPGTSTATLVNQAVYLASDIELYAKSLNPYAFYLNISADKKYSITAFIKDNPNPLINTMPINAIDGKINTLLIKNMITVDITGPEIAHERTAGNYPAASCCLRFHTVGTQPEDWYLPSIYELLFLYENLKCIDVSFPVLAMSSTLVDLTNVYILSANKCITYKTKNDSGSVLAFVAF